MLALFDFDKTITRRDTFIPFLFHSSPLKTILFFPVISICALLVVSKIISRCTAKSVVMRICFKNKTKEQMLLYGKLFSENIISNGIRPGVLEKIAEYKRSGYRVIIISASVYEWVAPFADYIGVELLATHLEYKGGRFTGTLLGKNCRGQEKVNRLAELVPDYKERIIHAYGDSSGDREMLSIATEKYINYFGL